MQTSLKLLDFDQGSHEWLAARLGVMTASKAGLLLTAGKSDDGIGDGSDGVSDAGRNGNDQQTPA